MECSTNLIHILLNEEGGGWTASHSEFMTHTIQAHTRDSIFNDVIFVFFAAQKDALPVCNSSTRHTNHFMLRLIKYSRKLCNPNRQRRKHVILLIEGSGSDCGYGYSGGNGDDGNANTITRPISRNANRTKLLMVRIAQFNQH